MAGAAATSLAEATLTEQAEALAAGRCTSAELTESVLERIGEAQPRLNCFRIVLDEMAREAAAEADRRIGAGERAPLLGVPVAIKDDTDLAGTTTMFGCRGDFEPKTSDAEVVRRLKLAGAVIVGKTTTPEFGQWPITEGEAFGVTRNPWNTDHTPGGSSGGSAAAVAARLVAGAIGSDGAGSVRIPASWTGLVGIKPQRGRISTWPDPEAFKGLTCFGPLTRTVADAALLLEAVSGNADGDRHKPPAPAIPFTESAAAPVRRLRIAHSERIAFSGAPAELDPRVGETVASVAETLKGLGHEIAQEDPDYGIVGLSFLPRATAGIAEWIDRVPDSGLLDPRTRAGARNGRLLGGPPLWVARKLEALVASRIGRIFRDHDVVLVPTTAQPPLPVGAIDGLGDWGTDKRIVGACPYAWTWNVIGWPGISVPAGLVDGLPVGAQLLGPPNSEGLLISLAAELEQELRWHERRPPEA